MTERKKAWSEPELIVLVRSKPEEAVLDACKGMRFSNITGGPEGRATGCNIRTACTVCSTTASS